MDSGPCRDEGDVRQVDASGQTFRTNQDDPDLETEQQILEKYENNPYFESLVQRMVTKTIKSGVSLTGQDVGDRQGNHTADKRTHGEQLPQPMKKKPRTETVTTGNNLVQGNQGQVTPVKLVATCQNEVDKVKSPSAVADPGFSPGGAPTPKNAIIFQFFAENCMKMKEFEPPGGGRVPGAPPWIRQ